MTTTTLHYLADYGAPPAADCFHPMTTTELREIKNNFPARTDLDEARTDAYLLDEATAKVAHDMSADGVPVLMARDEDGLYFATTEPGWRVYSPCGARKWITADTAAEATDEAESWLAVGDWGEWREETVTGFVEPYAGINDDFNFTTDSWRREYVEVAIEQCAEVAR